MGATMAHDVSALPCPHEQKTIAAFTASAFLTGEREEAWRRRSIDVSPKFEAKWLEEEDCAERVKKAWSDALEAGACNVTEIQDFVLRDLHEWDKNVLKKPA